MEVPLSKRPLEERDISTLTPQELRELVRRKEDVIRQQEARQLPVNGSQKLTMISGYRETYEETTPRSRRPTQFVDFGVNEASSKPDSQAR